MCLINKNDIYRIQILMPVQKSGSLTYYFTIFFCNPQLLCNVRIHFYLFIMIDYHATFEFCIVFFFFLTVQFIKNVAVQNRFSSSCFTIYKYDLLFMLLSGKINAFQNLDFGILLLIR